MNDLIISNAMSIALPDGGPPIWLCSTCRQPRQSEEDAKKCCNCMYCGTFVGIQNYAHKNCRANYEAERDAEVIATAEKLESWDGFVYWEGAGYRDGIFEDLDSLRQWFEFAKKPLPEYVFICIQDMDFPSVDMEDILQNIEDNGWEDITSNLTGEKELKAAIAAFNEANAGQVAWSPDYKRMVRVTPLETN